MAWDAGADFDGAFVRDCDYCDSGGVLSGGDFEGVCACEKSFGTLKQCNRQGNERQGNKNFLIAFFVLGSKFESCIFL